MAVFPNKPPPVEGAGVAVDEPKSPVAGLFCWLPKVAVELLEAAPKPDWLLEPNRKGAAVVFDVAPNMSSDTTELKQRHFVDDQKFEYSCTKLAFPNSEIWHTENKNISCLAIYLPSMTYTEACLCIKSPCE